MNCTYHFSIFIKIFFTLLFTSYLNILYMIPLSVNSLKLFSPDWLALSFVSFFSFTKLLFTKNKLLTYYFYQQVLKNIYYFYFLYPVASHNKIRKMFNYIDFFPQLKKKAMPIVENLKAKKQNVKIPYKDIVILDILDLTLF